MTDPTEIDSLKNLGKYTLIEKLSDGYLGPVYKSLDQELDRVVEIRILSDGIKWDADVVVTVETVDAQGVVYLRRGSEQILLRPGESWTRDGKSAVEWGGVKSVITSKERVSNFGVLDKSRIQVVKE